MSTIDPVYHELAARMKKPKSKVLPELLQRLVTLEQAKILSELPSPPEEIASRAAFDQLVRELGIETADLLGPMLAAKRSGRFPRLTFAHDFHWNAAGNTVAAEVVAEAIRRGEKKEIENCKMKNEK